MKDENQESWVHSLTTAKSQSTYREATDSWKIAQTPESVRSKTFEVKDFETRRIKITYTGKDFEETFSEILLHFSLVIESVKGDIFSLPEDVIVDVNNLLKNEDETKTQD